MSWGILSDIAFLISNGKVTSVCSVACPVSHPRSGQSEAPGVTEACHLPVTDDVPEASCLRLLGLRPLWSTLVAIVASGQCRSWLDSSGGDQGTAVTSLNDSPPRSAGWSQEPHGQRPSPLHGSKHTYARTHAHSHTHTCFWFNNYPYNMAAWSNFLHIFMDSLECMIYFFLEIFENFLDLIF